MSRKEAADFLRTLANMTEMLPEGNSARLFETFIQFMVKELKGNELIISAAKLIELSDDYQLGIINGMTVEESKRRVERYKAQAKEQTPPTQAAQ